jgi:hypothetical protein
LATETVALSDAFGSTVALCVGTIWCTLPWLSCWAVLGAGFTGPDEDVELAEGAIADVEPAGADAEDEPADEEPAGEVAVERPDAVADVASVPVAVELVQAATDHARHTATKGDAVSPRRARGPAAIDFPPGKYTPGGYHPALRSTLTHHTTRQQIRVKKILKFERPTAAIARFWVFVITELQRLVSCSY